MKVVIGVQSERPWAAMFRTRNNYTLRLCLPILRPFYTDVMDWLKNVSLCWSVDRNRLKVHDLWAGPACGGRG